MPVLPIATVIPAYNEGARLARLLGEWAELGLTAQGVLATAIVVDDGSATAAAAIQERAAADTADRLQRAGSPHRISYVRADRNRGKGAAIRFGWEQAPADAVWLGFIDADGAIPAREYWRVASMLPETGADAVCACRVRMAGRTVERTLFRHLQGRLFATFVEELFHLGFYDTQTGMKSFRAEALRPLLPRLREERWLLDVEILALFAAAGRRAVEVPVDCHMHGGSSLVLGVDPLRMAVQLVRLRRRLRKPQGGGA